MMVPAIIPIKSIKTAAFSAIPILFLSAQAIASPLDPLTPKQLIDITGIDVGDHHYENFSNTDTSFSFNSATATGTGSISLSPTPSVNSYSSSTVNSLNSYAQLDYLFGIEGEDNTEINIIVNSFLATDTESLDNNYSFSYSTAGIAIGYTNNLSAFNDGSLLYHTVNSRTDCYNTSCTSSTQLEGSIIDTNTDNSISSITSFEDKITILSNVLYKITLYTQAESLNARTYSFSDPFIQIDPTFQNLSSYHLVFSEGIGNSPISTPVPEPTTMLLFGTGLAGLSLVGRKTRR